VLAEAERDRRRLGHVQLQTAVARFAADAGLRSAAGQTAAPSAGDPLTAREKQVLELIAEG
jgi:ATP/maltotriose-dependent transcriptional regulator MalT